MKTKLFLAFFTFISFTSLAQWKPTNGLFSGDIRSIITNNGEIIAGSDIIYKSSDNGKTWIKSNNGMATGITAIRALSKISTYLVAGTSAGVYYSTDNGNNWIASAGTASLDVYCIVAKGTNLFMSTFANGVYKSANYGQNWSAANTNIPTPYDAMQNLVVKGNDIYVCSVYGVYKSSNDGSTWAPANTSLTNTWIISLAVAGNNIIAGTRGGGVFKSVNDGGSWSPINYGIGSTDVILGLGVNGSSVYASVGTGVLYKTTDYINWNPVSLGNITPTSTYFSAFYSSGSEFYLGSHDYDGYGECPPLNACGIYKTIDDGTTFKHIGLTDYPVSVLEVSGNNIFGGTNDISGNSYRISLFKTTESDSVWSYNIGGFAGNNVTALKSNGAVMYLFDDESYNSAVFRSTNNGNNWSSTGINASDNRFTSFAIAGSLIYASDNSPYYSSTHVFASSDNGATWNPLGTGLPSSTFNSNSLAIKGTTLFLATDNGIYKNTVGQNSWTLVNSGLTNTVVKSIIVSGTTIYAGTQGGGIFKSVNDGGQWNECNTGIPLFANVTCFASSSSNVFAGTDNGVFVSSNAGGSWANVNTGLTDTSITVMAASANYLWAGTTNQGVWRRELTQIVTGTENPMIETSFKVSPNPASHNITIEIPQNNAAIDNQISIFNSVGGLVWHKATADAVVNVDLHSFAKGIYVVKINNSEKNYTEKIIVQ